MAINYGFLAWDMQCNYQQWTEEVHVTNSWLFSADILEQTSHHQLPPQHQQHPQAMDVTDDISPPGGGGGGTTKSFRKSSDTSSAAPAASAAHSGSLLNLAGVSETFCSISPNL